MSRAERMAELRQWASLIKREPKWVRVMMTEDKYAHWADVNFLLDEIDMMHDETVTPHTALEPVRLPPPSPVKMVRRVDPADFTETITIEPPTAVTKPVKVTEKKNPLPEAPKLEAPKAPLKIGNETSKGSAGLTESELWNAAVAKAQAAAERVLSEAAIKHSDIYSIKAAMNKSLADCRKPIEWDEGYNQ